MKKTLKRVIIFAFAILAVLVVVYIVMGICYVNQKPDSTLAENGIGITTYAKGLNQPTHPSIISFDEEWNGYKYWLSYSPYPEQDGDEENPCIVVSNDLENWTIPDGLANPIATNEETDCSELKDPHILYREDLNRIEVWYLGRISEKMGGDGTSLVLFRKYTYDGQTWSDYEVMNDHMLWLCPTISWDGEKYNMWTIGYDVWDTKGDFVYLSSKDGENWSDPTSCSIGGVTDNLDLWHGTVTYADGTYHFVYVDYERQNVIYTKSTDGINFDTPVNIVNNEGFYDHLYRPALLIEDGKYTCFYGLINDLDQWSIGESQGTSVDTLTGVTGTSKILNLHNLKGFIKLSRSYFESNLRLNLKSKDLGLRIIILLITIVTFVIFAICFVYGIIKIFKKN